MKPASTAPMQDREDHVLRHVQQARGRGQQDHQKAQRQRQGELDEDVDDGCVARHEAGAAQLARRLVAAAPRSRFKRSASKRMTPSDVAAGDGLAGPACSLRVFMRRVRKAPSRPSIGGCTANADHSAQNVMNVAAATTTVKISSVSARSMAAVKP